MKFGAKRHVPFRKGFSQGGTVKTRRNPLRPLTCGVGKAFCPVTPSFGACRLYDLAVVQFVTTGKVLKTPIVVPAIEHPQRLRIDLGNGKVKMAPAIFDMADDKARTIGTDMEFRIHRSEEFRQLPWGHLPLGRYREMTDAISAAFCGGERVGIMKGDPITRQNLDPFIFIGFVEQMTSEILNAAGAIDPGRLHDHRMISRRRPRSLSSSARADASSASWPDNLPALTRRAS